MDLRALSIGGLNIGFPVFLAPMAGITDSPMRIMSRRGGCGAVFTEVVTAAGLSRRIRRTVNMVYSTCEERPVAAHLYGSDPDTIIEAARVAGELGMFDFIDLNCGCPVRRIMARGAGAALMADPGKIERIVSGIRAAVKLPVTVKTRIGLAPDRQNAVDLAHAVENGGGSALFMHARFASAVHSGDPDWNLLALVKGASGIPVVGNGGVKTPADTLRMLETTGVDGVMIGRAAIGNPWLFGRIRNALAGMPERLPSRQEIRRAVTGHFEMCVAAREREKGFSRVERPAIERSAALHFRPHLIRYLAGFEGSAALRKSLNDMISGERINEALEYCLGSGRDDAL